MGTRDIEQSSDLQMALLNPVIGLVQGLDAKQLSDVTIDAILKHRALRDQAEMSQSEFDKASAGTACAEEIAFAQRAHIAAMLAMVSHQSVLSTLLDILGHIPDIPSQTSN